MVYDMGQTQNDKSHVLISWVEPILRIIHACEWIHVCRYKARTEIMGGNKKILMEEMNGEDNGIQGIRSKKGHLERERGEMEGRERRGHEERVETGSGWD